MYGIIPAKLEVSLFAKANPLRDLENTIAKLVLKVAQYG